MKASTLIRDARRRSEMTQRDLAAASGIAQPAIARIEAGRVSPTLGTLDRLLMACGQELRLESRRGEGVDRTVIARMLDMTVQQRAELSIEEARNLERLESV